MGRFTSARVRIAVQGGPPPLVLEFHRRRGAVYLRLTDQAVARTVEIEDLALADYDGRGRPVGFELLGLDDPHVIEVLRRLKSRFAAEVPELGSVEASAI